MQFHQYPESRSWPVSNSNIWSKQLDLVYLNKNTECQQDIKHRNKATIENLKLCRGNRLYLNKKALYEAEEQGNNWKP
jgi:subtilase family serine protease